MKSLLDINDYNCKSLRKVLDNKEKNPPGNNIARENSFRQMNCLMNDSKMFQKSFRQEGSL